MSLLLGSCLAYIRPGGMIKSTGTARMVSVPKIAKQVPSTRLFSTPAEKDVRTYAAYSIYKGKGAMSLKAIPVAFNTVKGNRVVGKEGMLVMEFAPSAGSAREYNWGQKVTFGLSATECGELLAADKSKTIEFTHDPYAGGKLNSNLSFSLTS